MTLFHKTLFAVSMAFSVSVGTVAAEPGAAVAPSVPGAARREAPAQRPYNLIAQLPAQQADPTPRACPDGAKLFAVPVLVPGQPAWVTVQDKDGRPLANVSVFCNDDQHFTEGNGRLAFDVPYQGTLNVHLVGTDGKETANCRYITVNNGLLCRVGTERLVSSCMSGAPRIRATPTILYAPAVVAPNALESILGTGFNGRPDSECLIIDGRESETLSASPSALLSRVSGKLVVGPIKQAYVSTKGGESSNIIEEDVARAEVRFEDGNPDCRLAAVGTNLPILTVLNRTVLSAADGRPTGNPVIALPGGDNNIVTLQSQQVNPEWIGSASLLPTEPELTGPSTQKIDDELKKSVTQARLIKLQRRLLAVENRIIEARKHREEKFTSPEDEEKTTTELRALAVRESALQTAVTAHKAMLEAFGCSSQQIQQCLDDAAGGAFYAVEKSVKDVILVSRPGGDAAGEAWRRPYTGVRVTQNGAPQTLMPPPPPRRDPLSEPRMVMWSPAEGVVALGIPVLQAPELSAKSVPPKGVNDKAGPKSVSGSAEDKHKPVTEKDKPGAEKSSAKDKPKTKKADSKSRKPKSKTTTSGRKHHRHRR